MDRFVGTLYELLIDPQKQRKARRRNSEALESFTGIVSERELSSSSSSASSRLYHYNNVSDANYIRLLQEDREAAGCATCIRSLYGQAQQLQALKAKEDGRAAAASRRT